MLPIIFVMPMIQLLVLSFAVDYEIKHIKLFFVDQDKSQFSGMLTINLRGQIILSSKGILVTQRMLS